MSRKKIILNSLLIIQPDIRQKNWPDMRCIRFSIRYSPKKTDNDWMKAKDPAPGIFWPAGYGPDIFFLQIQIQCQTLKSCNNSNFSHKIEIFFAKIQNFRSLKLRYNNIFFNFEFSWVYIKFRLDPDPLLFRGAGSAWKKIPRPCPQLIM